MARRNELRGSRLHARFIRRHRPTLLRRPDMTEHRQQRQVIADFSRPRDQQRPAEARQHEEIAGNHRADRRREAARNRREARRGRHARAA